MDELSSCYFCGGALDVSLEKRPVVPDALAAGTTDETTVVLCRTCGRKLDAILETVVDGADTGGPVQSAASDIESTLGDDADVLQSVGDDATDDGDASEMQWGGDAADDTGAESGSDGDGTSGEGTGQRAGGNGQDGSDGDPTYSDGRRAGYTEDTDEPDEKADDDGTDHTLTRLENTKVMRLLQNREFPVDRDDFVTVASIAYEVSPRDCEKVLDLAVEHDLLREDGTDLYAGDRWQ